MYTDAVKKLQDASSANVQQFLATHNLFAEEVFPKAQWVGVPDVCHTLIANASSTIAWDQRKDSETTHIKELDEAWQQRHARVPPVPASNAGPVRHRPCVFGVCCCQGFQKSMLLRLTAFLKTLSREELLEGGAVLCWRSSFVSHPSEHEVSERRQLRTHAPAAVGAGVQCGRLTFTHIPFVNQRPFRCVLATVNPSSGVVFAENRSIWLAQASGENGGPKMQSVAQFVQELNPDMAWDVAAMYLSTRATPIAHLDGKALAVRSHESQRLWKGTAWEEALKRLPRPLHERLQHQRVRAAGPAEPAQSHPQRTHAHSAS